MRKEVMRLTRFANFWIMLLVAAGLLLAPLIAPVLANPMPGHMGVTNSDLAGNDMQAMAGEMPCCPDQTKSKICEGCPFVALCMLTVPLPPPAGAASLIERYPLRSQFTARDDRLLSGLGAKPPDHPPRTHV